LRPSVRPDPSQHRRGAAVEVERRGDSDAWCAIAHSMVETTYRDGQDTALACKLKTYACLVTCVLVVASSRVFLLPPVGDSYVNQLNARVDGISRESKVDESASTRFCSTRSTLEKNAARKIQERENWFEAELPHERDYFRTAKLDVFASGFLFSPYYSCPFTMEKSTSVAQHFDGGKWVCGLTELSASKDASCVAFSFGSNYDVAFENDINAKRGAGSCEIHIFDPTMSWEGAGHSRDKLAAFVSKLPQNYHFHELGLGSKSHEKINIDGKTFDTVTLLEAFQEYGNSTGVDFLKFDVEGFEFDILESTEWDKVRVGVILFEVHGNIIERIRARPYTLANFHAHLGRLERAGFRLYSTEPVCGGCGGQFEVALVHKDWHPVHKFTTRCR